MNDQDIKHGNLQIRTLLIFTRTPLHVGAGSSVGAIDQPIQRERHTGFPIIPGSSIKGVLRDQIVRKDGDAAGNELFGFSNKDESAAGQISFSEAKLLLFPIRSAKGAYAMGTCAMALERYARDARLPLKAPAHPKDGDCLAGDEITLPDGDKKGVVLEEYRFNVTGIFPGEWADHLSALLNDAVLNGARKRFVLLSDGDFSHFAQTCCQVNQHVSIVSATGVAKQGALFNEETVPSETLLYSTLTVLPRGKSENQLFTRLSEEQLLQFGGNSTTGLGFCTTKLGI